MKKLILFLSISFIFASCEKEDFEPETAPILMPSEVDYSTIPYYSNEKIELRDENNK